MKRGRTWTRRILFALVVLAFVYGSAYLALSIVATSRLDAALEEARRSGAPLSPGDANPPPVPDAENAAVLLKRAFVLIPEDPETSYELWEAIQDDPSALSPEEARVFETWIAESERGLALLEEAFERPRCLFRHDWSRGLEDVADHVPGLQLAARVLSFRGLIQTRAGDVDGALATSRLLVLLGRAARSHPALIDLLVGSGIEGSGLHVAERAVALDQPSPRAVQSLLDVLDADRDEGSLEATYVFERAFGNYLLERLPDDEHTELLIETMDVERGLVSGLGTALFDAPAFQLDHARFLREMERVVELSKRPLRETREDWASLVAEAGNPPWYDRLTHSTLTVYDTAVRAWALRRVRTDLARIALRVELYDIREGDLPDSLDLLRVPGGTRDHVGESAYVYRPEADGGYVLYSVGPNGVDEGGQETDNPRREGDVVWRRPTRDP